MAEDDPSVVHEHSNTADESSHCPFCAITRTYPSVSPFDTTNPAFDPDNLSPPTYILLSTAHVVAFLDIAPLTRGHVLLSPRHHRTKIGDLSPFESAEIGRVLPLVARAVLGATFPDITHDAVDYNVVQNNGPGAAQVIPHVHFHIIPRPPLDYRPAKIPTGLAASYIQFGRGQRHELDDEDAAELVKEMRERLKTEWEKEFGKSKL